MRIGILVLSIGNVEQRKFYNLQEIGLAKALDAYCEKVRVWRLTPSGNTTYSERLEGYKNIVIEFLPSKSIGTNSFMDCSNLDKDIDVLICFTDTQVTVPRIYKWAKRNKILFLPYIGVIKSHSAKAFRQILVNVLFERNLRVYRKSYCLAKTPDVKISLEKKGVQRIIVAPIGLDTALLKQDYEQYVPAMLKEKYGYKKDNRIILFIGRLTKEKRPLQMVELFSNIIKKNSSFRLLMVGTGELEESLKRAIKAHNLEEKIRRIEHIANSEIWELYRFADFFINLNQQEIFGMAILEAMYYGCKVVAWKAPGPDFIIENGVSGWLVENEEELLARILEEYNMNKNQLLAENSHKRIVQNFTWEGTVKEILLFIKEVLYK